MARSVAQPHTTHQGHKGCILWSPVLQQRRGVELCTHGVDDFVQRLLHEYVVGNGCTKNHKDRCHPGHPRGQAALVVGHKLNECVKALQDSKQGVTSV